MSGIDSVIAASRRPGDFSERRQFTVSRSRGIQKMRRFALADPHFYILELIQSAIANRAHYIDIQVSETHCNFAYIGGGLRQHELAQLFDFLFASKDRTDIGHIRELALGINAVLLFKPDTITIESGDGSLEGTTRMVVHGGHDRVEIGTPRRALAGTYVAISGMKRSKLPDGMGQSWFSDRAKECGVIESRCLAAPIPILVNQEPLFGHSTQRTPGLFGYRRVLSFDEGDLYGTIGHSPSFGNPSFQLLTWGVSIQHKMAQLVDGAPIGGVICFDRLRKTVDHSGIVEDERLREMWARLRPYAEQLHTGKAQASVYALTGLDGTAVAPVQLRELLRSQPSIVLVPPDTELGSIEGRRAAAIGLGLEAHVLRGSTRHLPAMRALSGGKLKVVRPHLNNDEDVRFYSTTPDDAPARPWLTPPVDVPPIPTWKLGARLAGAAVGQEEQWKNDPRVIVDDLGVDSEASATVYTPETTHYADALDVWVQSSGRTVWRGPVASAYAGHVLVVELPDARVSGLRSAIDSGLRSPSRAAEVGRLMAAHAVPSLVGAFNRALLALRDMDVKPGSAAAGMGLSAIVRSVLPRLREREGIPALEFSQLEARDVDLLTLPLLRTLSGRAINLRDLAELANGQCGLVYGVIPSVPADLEGLDRDRILDLTETEERQLVMLLGESSYVRIDQRDVLAEARGLRCRDLALGLRQFPTFGLLVEGDDPSGWSQEDREAVEADLLVQLILRYTGENPPRPSDDPWEVAQWEECRRQACRQLQWYVCTHPDAGGRICELPLFLDVYDKPCGFRQIAGAMSGSNRLALYYGHSHGPDALGHLAAAAAGETEVDPEHRPTTLIASPFLHRLLSGHGEALPAFDFDLEGARVAQAESTPAFAAEAKIEAPGIRGVIGVPAVPPAIYDIVVILPGRERTRALSELAQVHEVVGWVRLEDDFEWNDEQLERLATIVRETCEGALADLLAALPQSPQGPELARRTTVLLDYASRHLSIHAERPDRIVPRVQTELVDRILSLPLFPSKWGGPISAWRLVRSFCGAVAEGRLDPTATVLQDVSSELPDHLAAWVQHTLHLERVVREPGPPQVLSAPTGVERIGSDVRVDDGILGATLSHWIAVLRPEKPAMDTRVMVTEFSEEPITSNEQVVWLKSDTPLIQWVQQNAATDPRILAWPLLAVYAKINEHLERVTNEHEVEFQRRVADAVERGELHLVRPVMAGSQPAFNDALKF